MGTLTRRKLIHSTLGGLAAASALGHSNGILHAVPKAPSEGVFSTKRRAKSVIQIWLWGGACHLDTFDPKPEAGPEYAGPFTHSLKTNVPGIHINPKFPLLAKQAHRYSLIRSMTHGNNSHETASYMVQTGHPAGGKLVHPCLGAVLSHHTQSQSGYSLGLPPYIVMTKAQGRFSEAGFLGNKHKPFATGGNPAASVFAVDGIISPGITEKRQKARLDLLQKNDQLAHFLNQNATVGQNLKARQEAYDFCFGDLGNVFNPKMEKEATREAYGTQTFGQSCLVARRLVEAGVPYVTINFTGWDTHKKHFEAMNTKLPQLDQGVAMLLQDLDERGLLQDTIVWVGGEFGRTPKIQQLAPWNGGRSHFGAVFSTLIAGGGFQSGQIVGATDARGMEVADRPVSPWDFMGSLYTRLGIDPSGSIPHPYGYSVPLKPDHKYKQSGGFLHEIM
ncbi:MAG: DUF1501 domain-containing protein [Planctomycetes bacterium]|nr:DUF1501 domain-containing protein [Planctomycetota bacterium]